MRGVTSLALPFSASMLISTRTPHAGSDGKAKHASQVGDISTRTPHAGSDLHATVFHTVALISTRTPHAGSDL